ncbi:MAG: type II toxin-antitoxin system VapC family toxin [Acidimicrobiia bacterium]
MDASVFVEYLAPGSAVDAVTPLFSPRARCEYWAPDLCVLEVANALRKRYLSDQRFTRGHLDEAVEDMSLLQPVLIGAASLVMHALRYAHRLTMYDAAYVAVADLRRLPLCTLDEDLAATARAEGVEVLIPASEAFSQWLARPRR